MNHAGVSVLAAAEHVNRRKKILRTIKGVFCGRALLRPGGRVLSIERSQVQDFVSSHVVVLVVGRASQAEGRYYTAQIVDESAEIITDINVRKCRFRSNKRQLWSGYCK